MSTIAVSSREDSFQFISTARHNESRAKGECTAVSVESIGCTKQGFFATREEDAQAEYNSQLVQKSSLKAFEIGLRDKHLETNLCPFLRQDHITDEELLWNVYDLAKRQAERKAKVANAPERRGAAKANTSWVEFEIGKEQSQGAPKSSQKESKFENEKLLADIKELKSNLADLEQQCWWKTNRTLWGSKVKVMALAVAVGLHKVILNGQGDDAIAK